jgi:KUP system potassium uptake protein
VLPALVVNYVGQGAIIAADPKALDSPFYALAHGWTLLPMVALATVATIIASQAVISGAFTLTEQAINLNLCPRMLVQHTSKEERGQVYVPLMNAVLAIACITLVVTFRGSDRLAAMFGLAVSSTMLATDILFYVVATRALHWNRWVALGLALSFALVDATFVAAGLPKFLDGAWVPLLIAATITLIAITWLMGRRAVAQELHVHQEPLEKYLAEHPEPTQPLRGTVVLLSGDATAIPFIDAHRWLERFLPRERLVLLKVTFVPRPYVGEQERVTIDRVATNLVRVEARFGYMEAPRIAPILRACGAADLDIDRDTTTFVYRSPVIVGKKPGGLAPWQRKLFDVMQRLSRTLASELGIYANRQIAVGVEVAV